MAIEQSDKQVESKQPFPANEDSVYPPRGTAKLIVGLTVGISLVVVLFGIAFNHTSNKGANPLPATQSQPSPPGSHDQQ